VTLNVTKRKKPSTSVLAVVAADLVADHAPFLERDDPAAKGVHDARVMRGHQDGDAKLVDSEQQLDDLPADERIEFPVGSSAMISAARARARGRSPSAAARRRRACGQLVGLPPSPTTASARSTAGRIRPRGVPVTSRANATFSRTERVGGA